MVSKYETLTDEKIIVQYKINKEKDFRPWESNELHQTFQVDGVRFTHAQYDKRTPGLFKEEETTDKMTSLCSKMYCCSDVTGKNYTN